MKKIEAIIEPTKIEEVKNALRKIGLTNVTLTEQKGTALQEGHTRVFRGTEYKVDSFGGVKIELILQDNQAEAATEILFKAAAKDELGESSLIIIPGESAHAKVPA